MILNFCGKFCWMIHSFDFFKWLLMIISWLEGSSCRVNDDYFRNSA